MSLTSSKTSDHRYRRAVIVKSQIFVLSRCPLFTYIYLVCIHINKSLMWTSCSVASKDMRTKNLQIKLKNTNKVLIFKIWGPQRSPLVRHCSELPLTKFYPNWLTTLRVNSHCSTIKIRKPAKHFLLLID